MNYLAPIALFVYCRPGHTQRMLESLMQNELASNSELFIFADGPKESASSLEILNIEQTRKIIRQKKWCKKVSIVESEKNKGLANSIIDGVTDVVNKYGKIIVLEDDLVISPYFLKFMNDALDVYNNDSRVISIGACNYFALGKKVPATFFMPIPDCLGWATWLNRWRLFEPNSKKLLLQLTEKKIIEKFNLYGFFDFYGMLKQQAENKISSWAIRWQAIAYLNDMLTLYPNPSLSQHIQSKESTHASNLDIKPLLADKPIFIQREIISVKEKILYLTIRSYYSYFTSKFLKKIKRRVRFYFYWLVNRKKIISENNLN